MRNTSIWIDFDLILWIPPKFSIVLTKLDYSSIDMSNESEARFDSITFPLIWDFIDFYPKILFIIPGCKSHLYDSVSGHFYLSHLLCSLAQPKILGCVQYLSNILNKHSMVVVSMLLDLIPASAVKTSAKTTTSFNVVSSESSLGSHPFHFMN